MAGSRRRRRSLAGVAARAVRVVVVMGPPGAGKSTYVGTTAAATDVVVDLDVIASALRPMHAVVNPHEYPDHVRRVALAARASVIRAAVELAEPVTVWIISSMPDPVMLAAYRSAGYELVTVDPGRDVVLGRLGERPARAREAVDRWYSGSSLSG